MSVKGMLVRAGILTTGEDIDIFRGKLRIAGRSQAPDTTTVTVVLENASNDVLIATGTTKPVDAETGFAKGCLFIDTDVATGLKGLYENVGTNTSCVFNLIGSIAAAEIVLAEGWMLVGNASGAGVALDGGATGKFLVSNGTTMVSVSASGDVTMVASGAMTVSDEIIRTVKVSLTATEVKALTTPFQLVAAPAANHFLRFLGATLVLNYGSNVFIESTDNLAIRYTDGSGVIVSQTIEMTGFIDQAVDTITNAQPVIDAIVASSAGLAQALVLDNIDGDFTGNAADDNTLDVYTTYVDVDMS